MLYSLYINKNKVKLNNQQYNNNSERSLKVYAEIKKKGRGVEIIVTL